MESLRRLFSFSKGERIAAFTLLTIILVLVVMCLLRPFRYTPSETVFHNLDSLLLLRETALKEMQEKNNVAEKQVNGLHPFPFDPNTLTEEEWRQMGFTDRQIRNIVNYKAAGGKFYSKKDFGKLYTISESDYIQLESYIALPETAQSTRKKTYDMNQNSCTEGNGIIKPVSKVIPIVDINTVDSITLIELPQIGPYIAYRIITYRDKLGGFIDKDQLREVKGMDSARCNIAFPYIRLDSIEIHRIDINRSDFKTLVHHPYLSYNQVKTIVNHREKRGMIKNWTQLQMVVGDAEPLNPMMESYLKY